MITVEEATSIVLANAVDFGSEKVTLQMAIGRLLREDLVADRDFPPFNRVAMDGIAIRFEDLEKGQSVFPIVGVQAAGAPQLMEVKKGSCIEVMTGAMLPKGLDTVIRYEDIFIENETARLEINVIKNGENVHKQGTDRIKGDCLVKQGKRISPAEIGVAATVGKSVLQVAKLPKVAIIATGDELVMVDAMPEPYQIRSSNVYTLAALLQQNGIPADLQHIADDVAATENALRMYLLNYDVLVISGGVSKGKFDYVPEVLKRLGVEQLFHQVQQKPGKPFWFGKNAANKIVFALPGNPTSSFMCSIRYFLPWFRTCFGLEPFDYQMVVLAADFNFKPNLQYFLQVKIHNLPNGTKTATPLMGKGSGDLANLADADGFLELPAAKSVFKKGEIYQFWKYRM